MLKSDTMGGKTLGIDIHAQPNDETCGPTSLQAVYQYFGDTISLMNVVSEVKTLKTGGTLAVHLGNHALSRGYDAILYTYNLKMFDPTWFRDKEPIVNRLREQHLHKTSRKFQFASEAYIRFLEQGGRIRFEDLSSKMIKRVLREGTPILTGLSATYLYDCAREIGETNTYDPIKGEPVGHFVVIHGYDPVQRLAHIADPLEKNPISDDQHYKVKLQRLINSILLGVMTYDANLLVIKPKKWRKN